MVISATRMIMTTVSRKTVIKSRLFKILTILKDCVQNRLKEIIKIPVMNGFWKKPVLPIHPNMSHDFSIFVQRSFCVVPVTFIWQTN